jgi:hypothetical protein
MSFQPKVLTGIKITLNQVFVMGLYILGPFFENLAD